MHNAPENPGRFILDHPIIMFGILIAFWAWLVFSGHADAEQGFQAAFSQKIHFYTVLFCLMAFLLGIPILAPGLPTSRWLWVSVVAFVTLMSAGIFFKGGFTHDPWLDFHIISCVLAAIVMFVLAPYLLSEASISLVGSVLLILMTTLAFEGWSVRYGFYSGFEAPASTGGAIAPLLASMSFGVGVLFAHFLFYWARIAPPANRFLIHGDSDIQSDRKTRFFAAHLVNMAVPGALFCLFSSAVIAVVYVPDTVMIAVVPVYLLIPMIVMVSLCVASFATAMVVYVSAKFTNINTMLSRREQQRRGNAHRIVIGVLRHTSPKIHGTIILSVCFILVTVFFEGLTEPASGQGGGLTLALQGRGFAVGAVVKYGIVMLLIPAIALLTFKSVRLAVAIAGTFSLSDILSALIFAPFFVPGDTMVLTGVAVSKIVVLSLIMQLTLVWRQALSDHRGYKVAIIAGLRSYGAVYIASLVLFLCLLNLFVLLDTRNGEWATTLYLRSAIAGGLAFLIAPSVLFVTSRISLLD